ncbi:MAG: XRE family transcriptional regulator [Treponemataceae bacterium]|nr:XRE family transcriptional regulator [Treponemataceae bacterium]
MVNEIKSVAERIVGLRDVLDISVEEAAKACNVSVEQYLKYESGESDIPLGILDSMAKAFKIDVSTLISGEEPRNKSYFVTKLGEEGSVNRHADYEYLCHGQGFEGRKIDPYVVSVPPRDTEEINFNQHPGQEFDFVIEGKLKVVVDSKEFVLVPGESVIFDAKKPHGFLSLDGTTARFLAIVI